MPKKELTNEQLLANYQQADVEAFEIFFRRHKKLVFNFLKSKLGNKADAEEAFQETFFRIHKYIHKYNSEQNALSWIFTIARNSAVDVICKNSRLSKIKQATEVIDIEKRYSKHFAMEAIEDLESLMSHLSREEVGLIKSRFLYNEPYKLPSGYSIEWSGQYESIQRVKEKLKVILPITLLIILLLVFKNTGTITETMIVLLGIPFSAIGAIWLLYILGYNMSVAVWVGLIALVGIDAEMAIFMLLYLNLAHDRRVKEGKMNTFKDLKEAIHEGAVKRIRPKMMTVMTTFIALMPVLLAPVSQAGADVMKRMAAPMVGGIFSSFLLELLVYPAIFAVWKGRKLGRTV